jgi:hypothetical protein
MPTFDEMLYKAIRDGIVQENIKKALIPGIARLVTPNDTANLPSVSQAGTTLYIGTIGNIKVDLAEGGTGIVFKNVSGDFPRRVVKVYATGTSALDIIADY